MNTAHIRIIHHAHIFLISVEQPLAYALPIPPIAPLPMFRQFFQTFPLPSLTRGAAAHFHQRSNAVMKQKANLDLQVKHDGCLSR